MNRCFFQFDIKQGLTIYIFVLNRHHLFIQEKKEFEQKFSKEQAALREQLQVRQNLHYSSITWLLLFSGLPTTHNLYPKSHKSIPSGKLGGSVSQTVLNCKSSLPSYPFAATVMLQLQGKKFCAELIFLSQRFISRLLEFQFLRSLSCRQPSDILNKLHGRNQVIVCEHSSLSCWLNCGFQVTGMIVAGSQPTTLTDSLMSDTWHHHCFCHHSCPQIGAC